MLRSLSPRSRITKYDQIKDDRQLQPRPYESDNANSWKGGVSLPVPGKDKNVIKQRREARSNSARGSEESDSGKSARSSRSNRSKSSAYKRAKA